MLKQIEKIIIVVGCQRSGTTLLGQILGAPSNAFLLDESDGLYDWFEAFTGALPDAEEIFDKMLVLAATKYREAQQRIMLDRDHKLTFATDIKYLVLKAPNLTYSYKEIAQLPVPTFVVYAVRDPRSVVFSMINYKHNKFVDNQLVLLRKHKELMTQFTAEIRMMEDKNLSLSTRNALTWYIKSGLYNHFIEHNIPVLMNKYEDLVADTEEVCKLIANKVEIPFDNQMLSHEIIYQGIAQGETDRTRPVDSNSVNSWQSMMSKQQEEQIINVAGKRMNELGYNIKY